MHAAGATHHPRLSLPPFGVKTFHNAGQAAAFVTRRMLGGRKEAVIRAPMVSANGLVPIVVRNTPTPFPTTGRCGRREQKIEPAASGGKQLARPTTRAFGADTVHRVRVHRQAGQAAEQECAASAALQGGVLFFSECSKGLASDVKRTGNAALGNALLQQSVEVSFFVRGHGSAVGSGRKGFATGTAAKACRTGTVGAELNDFFGLVAMGTSKRNHAVSLPPMQSNPEPRHFGTIAAKASRQG